MANQIEIELTGLPVGETVYTTMFGGEYLGWTGFPGWQVQAEYFGIGHFRWPGGIIAEDRVEVDGYAYDLSEPNIVDNWPLSTGAPRPGLSEMFSYSVQNDLTFSMIVPTSRYVEAMFVDEAAARQWIADDIASFTTRLFSNHWGDLPSKLTLEIGAEYYSTNVWEERAHDPQTLEYFAEVYAEIVRALSIAEDAYGQEVFDIAVQASRFQSPDDGNGIRNGEEDDAVVFLQKYLDYGLSESIDGLIWHRYVYRFEHIDDHLGLNAANETTLAEHLAYWESELGHELDLITSWASPDVDSTGISDTSTLFDYGPRSAIDTLQMFSYLAANGVDTATLYGIDSPWPGAISYGGTTPEDYQVSYNGEVYRMMAESLSGLKALDGFVSNQVAVDDDNLVLEADILNVNSFSNFSSKTVTFISAWDLSSLSMSAVVDLPDIHPRTYIQATHIKPDSYDTDAQANYVMPIVEVEASQLFVRNIQDFDVTRLEFLSDLSSQDQIHENSMIVSAATKRSLHVLSQSDDFIFLDEPSDPRFTDASGGADRVTGSAAGDVIAGGEGPDWVAGGGGADLIFGGGVSFEDLSAWIAGDSAVFDLS